MGTPSHVVYGVQWPDPSTLPDHCDPPGDPGE
jgi:hypothetical protein